MAFIIPLVEVVVANLFYHVASKGIPSDQNAFVGLIVNYTTAFIASCVLFVVTGHNSNFTVELAKTNWASIALGLSIVGLEAGFIWIYRNGGEIGTANLIVTVLLALILLPVGYYFYGETLTTTKTIGAILCIAGIILISI